MDECRFIVRYRKFIKIEKEDSIRYMTYEQVDDIFNTWFLPSYYHFSPSELLLYVYMEFEKYIKDT